MLRTRPGSNGSVPQTVFDAALMAEGRGKDVGRAIRKWPAGYLRAGPGLTGAGSGLDDRGALDLDAHRGERRGGRAVHHRAVDDAELAAVARAVDRAAGHGSDDASLMGAHGGEGVEGAGVRLGDHDLLVGQDLAAADGDVRCAGEDVGRIAGTSPGGAAASGRAVLGGRRTRESSVV